MGGTSFEGISFEIYCLDDSVVIGNETYTKGQTITIVTSDAEGNIDVGMQFPVGHYAVREKAANNYYTMTTGQIHYFNVVEYQGEAFIQYEPDTNAVTFMDRVVRGDLSFVRPLRHRCAMPPPPKWEALAVHKGTYEQQNHRSCA